MDETMKIWLANLYDEAIEEAAANAKNEHIWLHGSSTKEEQQMHLENMDRLYKYIKVLEQKKEEI